MNFEKLKELRNMGFNKAVGVVTTEISEGYAKAEAEIGPQHINPIGSVHGGVLFTIADITAGAAATSRGRYMTTMSSNMNFLRPAINCKKLTGETREIKVGKQVCVYEVLITDETGREIAIATVTFHCIGKTSGEDFLKIAEQ